MKFEIKHRLTGATVFTAELSDNFETKAFEPQEPAGVWDAGEAEVKKFVQPDPSTGYRFTSYRLEGTGPWPMAETGYIYHKIDLSDLGEPYLSAVKRSLANDETPKETTDD